MLAGATGGSTKSKLTRQLLGRALDAFRALGRSATVVNSPTTVHSGICNAIMDYWYCLLHDCSSTT